MKIETIGAPAKADSFQTGRTPSQQAARERAIAKLTGGQPAAGEQPPQQRPVPNPSQVAPEDMSAITNQPSETKQENALEQAQTHNSEQAEPPKEATKDEVPLSAQYAQLARKEKALRAQAQELKRQQAAFKAAQESASKPAQSESVPQVDLSSYIPKDQLKSNLWNTLSELGITYDEVTQQALNAPNPSDIALQKLAAEVKADLKAMKDAQEQDRKAAVEQQTQAYQDALNQIRNDTKSLVESDESYETIKATNSIDDVVELIEETWKKDRVMLSVEEAAQEVENYLIEEAMKLTQIKKIQSRLRPASQPAPQQRQESQQSKQPQQAKTLTNGMGTSRPPTARERAIAAFKGTKIK